jgi:hypothetical protein
MAALKSKTPKLDPNAIYVCVEPFVTSALPGGPFPVRYLTRLKGDHPAVKLQPGYFVPDGSDDAAISKRRAAIYKADVAAAPPPPVHVPPAPLTDDQVLLQKETGERVDKRSPRVKANPSAFVPVNPDNLAIEEAVVAKQVIRNIGEDMEPTLEIAPGQWVRRSDPVVAEHPHIWAMPEFGERSEA